MTPHHEHEFEAAPGLPERLPAGERILWQGAPDWRALALHAFHVRKLAIYFAAMMGLQALYQLGQPREALARSLVASGLHPALQTPPALAAGQSVRLHVISFGSVMALKVGVVDLRVKALPFHCPCVPKAPSGEICPPSPD